MILWPCYKKFIQMNHYQHFVSPKSQLCCSDNHMQEFKGSMAGVPLGFFCPEKALWGHSSRVVLSRNTFLGPSYSFFFVSKYLPGTILRFFVPKQLSKNFRLDPRIVYPVSEKLIPLQGSQGWGPKAASNSLSAGSQRLILARIQSYRSPLSMQPGPSPQKRPNRV